MLITSCTWVLCHFITCTRIGNKRSIIWCNLFWVVGAQGGQNLPPPVSCSCASHTFISRLSPFTVPLPCHDLRSPARLHFFAIWQLTRHVHSCRLTFYDLHVYDITTVNKSTISPEVSLFLSPSANFRLLISSFAR